MRTDIEALRIIAAFGIIWFHSGIVTGKDIAYSGLIFFIIVSVFFSLESKRKVSIKTLSKKLLYPCGIWSLIYYTAYMATGSNYNFSTNNLILNILSTPSIHLWYLPFIFIVTLAITSLKIKASKTTYAFILIIILPLLFSSSLYWKEQNYPNPIPQYLHALPAVIVGCLFHIIKKEGLNKYSLIIYFLSIIIVCSLYRLALPGFTNTYFLGVIICLPLLFESSLFENNNLNKLSKLTFGIYLVHILPLALFNRIGIDGWQLPILTFFTSALTIHLLNIFIPIKYRKLFI